ncbi:BTB/POZ protein [Ochromonadaceae sp. CCMP2298]|nr:BTB/POZ protein [Ochromonadaceae sp. CCMP2298]
MSSARVKSERLERINSKRARADPPSDTEEALTEMEQLEQASKDMDEDLERLVTKHQKRKAAAVSITDTARILIADAKNQAETILAGAAEETKKWEAEKTALAEVQHFKPMVKLDVGGVRVTTSLTTLNRFPDSMIGCMFSGRHALPKGEDGYFFIDRDGAHFRHVLNFLRSPEGYKMVLTGAEVDELRRESEYYGIDQLMFPPSTEKSLPYKDLRTHGAMGTIAVRVDGEGVHTIRDTGAKIEYCRHCQSGIFNIGAQRCYITGFTAQLPPAAQPKVQGQCPKCYNQC